MVFFSVYDIDYLGDKQYIESLNFLVGFTKEGD